MENRTAFRALVVVLCTLFPLRSRSQCPDPLTRSYDDEEMTLGDTKVRVVSRSGRIYIGPSSSQDVSASSRSLRVDFLEVAEIDPYFGKRVWNSTVIRYADIANKDFGLMYKESDSYGGVPTKSIHVSATFQSDICVVITVSLLKESGAVQRDSEGMSVTAESVLVSIQLSRWTFAWSNSHLECLIAVNSAELPRLMGGERGRYSIVYDIGLALMKLSAKAYVDGVYVDQPNAYPAVAYSDGLSVVRLNLGRCSSSSTYTTYFEVDFNQPSQLRQVLASRLTASAKSTLSTGACVFGALASLYHQQP